MFGPQSIVPFRLFGLLVTVPVPFPPSVETFSKYVLMVNEAFADTAPVGFVLSDRLSVQVLVLPPPLEQALVHAGELSE